MKTIIEKLKSRSKLNTFLEFTTVWHIHSKSSYAKVLKNKNSNLNKMLSHKTHIARSQLAGGVTIVTGAKGRTAHSASDVAVFSGDQAESLGGTFFSKNELIELGVLNETI